MRLLAGDKIVVFYINPDKLWGQVTVSFSVNRGSFLWSKRSERQAKVQNILAVCVCLT